MKEMEITNTTQGVKVKKTLFIAALAAVLVFAFAASAFAYGPIYSSGYNPGYDNLDPSVDYSADPVVPAPEIGGAFDGYLSWKYVKAQTGAIDSPHGNYTTTTNKCAVCHAVHRADPDGVVLTAWGGVGSESFSDVMAPFESCFFCHGNGATFTDKTVEFFVTASGVLSPHTTCGRCHTASPHGADGSAYPLLASKLLNTKADPTITTDLGTNNNGLSAAMFDLSDEDLKDQGMTLGTGYLCVGCHGSATNEHVFAVNERGATPALHYTANPGYDVAGNVTGHQVWVGASSTWNQPQTELGGPAGTWYSGGGAHDYYEGIYKYTFTDDGITRYFKVDVGGPGRPPVPAPIIGAFDEVDANGDPLDGGLVNATTTEIIAAYGTWDSEIAYNNAYGCGACHDATRSNGKLAFPHGYVDAVGAPAPKWGNAAEGIMDADGFLQTSFLWMTIGADADDAKVLMRTKGNNNIDANVDGACLKCHVSGDGTAGVGKTY